MSTNKRTYSFSKRISKLVFIGCVLYYWDNKFIIVAMPPWIPFIISIWVICKCQKKKHQKQAKWSSEKRVVVEKTNHRGCCVQFLMMHDDKIGFSGCMNNQTQCKTSSNDFVQLIVDSLTWQYWYFFSNNDIKNTTHLNTHNIYIYKRYLLS